MANNIFLVLYRIKNIVSFVLFLFWFLNIFLQASKKQNIYRTHSPNFCFEQSGGSVREST